MNNYVEVIATMRYPFFSWNFWRAYVVQMRPYLLFVSGIAGVAGIAMGVQNGNDSLKLLVAFITFFLSYGFGQALTDCFQTDTDKISSPYRPLSSGTLSIRSVFIISIIGLCISGVLLYLFNPVSFWLCGLAVLGLASYSYIKKHFWFGGPIHNAWIVALIPVIGYFAISDPIVTGFPVRFYLNIGITFFSYASFVLIGYLKDIEADKATGYKTFPVVFGWDKTVLLGDLIALSTLILFWCQWNKNVAEILFGIAGSVVLITGQIVGHFAWDKNEKDALLPILSTVRSFILFHIAIAIHFHPNWWMILTVFYILFEITLYLRPSRYQV